MKKSYLNLINGEYKNTIKLIKNYYKNIVNKKFKKEIARQKSKLYIKFDTPGKFISSRNKYRAFKTKLEFQNSLQVIKKINFYYYLIAIFLIFSTLYTLFLSDYFSIKNIDVVTNDNEVNVNLVYKSVEDFRYTPLLFLDKNKIKEKILNTQPNINSIEIQKILPNNIKIILGSFNEVFTFENDNKKYKALENGTVVPTPSLDKTNNIIVKGLGTIGILDYKVIFTKNQLKSILNILEQLKTKTTFVSIKKIVYYKKEAELHITNNDDSIIIFDLTKGILTQIEKLNIFYKKYQNDIKAGIYYVDLRINEKLIYCKNETKKSCEENYNSIYGK